jgi:hypothetical protein
MKTDIITDLASTLHSSQSLSVGISNSTVTTTGMVTSTHLTFGLKSTC